MKIALVLRHIVAIAALIMYVETGASANFLEMPKTLPAAPDMRIADDCVSRGDVVALMGDLARSMERGVGEGKVPMKVVGSGGARVVAFGRPPKGQEPSQKTVLSCMTIFAGSDEMLSRLGLYVPDGSIPRGWFVYSPKLGIYADPRTVNLFPNRK
jgi:hypothetical protein